MKLHLSVECRVSRDHNDNRLILIPTEAGLAELERARAAQLLVEIPLEAELADVAPEVPVETPAGAPVDPNTPGEVPPPAPTAS